MDSSLKLFLIGIVVGISSLILASLNNMEELLNDPRYYFANFLSMIGISWQLIFLGIIVTTLPVIAISPLKKHFTPKQFFPFPFMAGNGFAFLSMQIIGIISKVLS